MWRFKRFETGSRRLGVVRHSSPGRLHTKLKTPRSLHHEAIGCSGARGGGGRAPRDFVARARGRPPRARASCGSYRCDSWSGGRGVGGACACGGTFNIPPSTLKPVPSTLHPVSQTLDPRP